MCQEHDVFTGGSEAPSCCFFGRLMLEAHLSSFNASLGSLEGNKKQKQKRNTQLTSIDTAANEFILKVALIYPQ